MAAYVRRCAAYLVVALALAGCAGPGGMPPYLVMLTNNYPSATDRCSGAALDATRILTAAHCADLPRVVTQLGQEAHVSVLRSWPDDDVAVLESDEPLYLSQFAQLARPAAGIAYVWAVCPYYFPQSVRFAFFFGPAVADLWDGATKVYDRWSTSPIMGDSQEICGGDSGGLVVQTDSVVGMITAVESPVPYLAIGRVFYTVSGARIAELMADEHDP